MAVIRTYMLYIRKIIRNQLNLPFYTILTIKLQLANNYENATNIFSKIFLTIVIAILACILIPLGFLSYYTFVCYKLIAVLLVKIYLGSKYDGYPSGFDASFTIGHEGARQIINFIISVEDTDESSTSPSDFYLMLKKQVQGRVENKNIPRLLSLAKRYFGYEFYKKDTFDVNDYISQFDVTEKAVASREDLQNAFDQIINNPLPKNNEAMWEAVISKQPVVWSNNKKHHVIIFRMNHTLGDAACGNKIIHALFADLGPRKLDCPNIKVTIPVNTSTLEEDTAWNVCKSHINHRREIRRPKANVLHNPKMSFHRQGAWFVEEDKKYVQIIKNIKNRRDNLTFNSVVIAAVSLSLSKFCQKRGQSSPDTLPLLYAINTKPEALGLYETSNLESINYENTLSFAQIKLPIICDKTRRDFTKNADVLYLLDLIEKEVELFKKSHDLKMNVWFSEHIMDYLTIPLMQCMMDLQNPAFDVSNLPGSKEYSVLGKKVVDVIFFTPDMTKFSVGFSCTTYNGRLQLGALVDDGTFSSADCQKLLLGLIKALELLDEATLDK